MQPTFSPLQRAKLLTIALEHFRQRGQLLYGRREALDPQQAQTISQQVQDRFQARRCQPRENLQIQGDFRHGRFESHLELDCGRQTVQICLAQPSHLNYLHLFWEAAQVRLCSWHIHRYFPQRNHRRLWTLVSPQVSSLVSGGTLLSNL